MFGRFRNPHVVLNAFCPTGGTTNVKDGTPIPRVKGASSGRTVAQKLISSNPKYLSYPVLSCLILSYPVSSCLMGLANSLGFFKQFGEVLDTGSKGFHRLFTHLFLPIAACDPFVSNRQLSGSLVEELKRNSVKVSS